MNVWMAIKDKIERETGYQVVSLPDGNDTIQTHQIILMITDISRTSCDDIYEVRGDLAMKHSHVHNWQMMTDLLDLGLSGMRAQAVMTTYDNGFCAMAIPFALHVKKDKDRQFAVKEIGYETN